MSEPREQTGDAKPAEATFTDAYDLVSFSEFIRGQTLRAASELGLFAALDDEAQTASTVAEELGADPEFTYRLLRALAYFEVLDEDSDRRFSLTPVGEYFHPEHPRSVQALVLLLWDPDRLAAWSHLSDIVRDGGKTGYQREFGSEAFERIEDDPELAAIFNESMTRLSQRSVPEALKALDGYDFSRFSHVCDVGGGHGYLLCSILKAHPHLEGTVLELPNVVEEEDEHWAPEFDVADRCSYLAGDMFEAVPEADAYFIKSVLHDWSDEDCVEILSTIHDAAPPDATLFIVEPIMPPPGETHRAIPSDINMMVGVGGRERTEAEFEALLSEAGWSFSETWEAAEEIFSVVEAVNA